MIGWINCLPIDKVCKEYLCSDFIFPKLIDGQQIEEKNVIFYLDILYVGQTQPLTEPGG